MPRSERDIMGDMTIVVGMIGNRGEPDNDEKAAVCRLLETFLIDIHRIADALEIMATPPKEKASGP